ncbi:MAG: flagellar assembly protein FliH [Treponema sp.]|jgi:flagellar assembly protein FliH|nr:flagellar assembly protein FliH [Treponema sp.]
MTKAVYRPAELEVLPKKIVLDSPTSYPELSHLAPTVEEVEEVRDEADVYDGPSADDLRREAEAFKEQWDLEKASMLKSAKESADKIIKEAEAAAFQLVKRQTDESLVIKRNAQAEADKIIMDANEKASALEAETKDSIEKLRKETETKAWAKGKDSGFEDGKAEVERLIQRSQVILERANDKRAEILAETEQEIIDLVLLISRKVIKVISENQKNIIVSNVVQALRKVKDRGNITIRVNMADLKLTTEHTKDFIQLVEGAKSIQVAEDSSVDEGGCIIETEFGEIDARISSQLAELESKILEVSPIKSRPKAVANGKGTLP